MKLSITLMLLLFFTSCGTTKGRKLAKALGKNNISLAKKLISEGADINKPMRGEYGFTAWYDILNYSGKSVKASTIQWMLDNGADPKKILFSEKSKGWIAKNDLIRYAAGVGRNDIIDVLMKNYKVELNPKKPHVFTPPLLEAANYGHIETVNYLLKLGANPRLKNREGKDYVQVYKDGMIRRKEYDERRSKIRNDDSSSDWLGKALSIGAVAGIASSSGISSAQQMQVISATTADVMSDNGGENLKNLKNEINSSTKTKSAGPSPVIKKTPKQTNAKIRKCSAKDQNCNPNVYHLCHLKESNSLGCYQISTAFNQSKKMWEYNSGAPSHRQCPKATGILESFGGGSFSPNSFFQSGPEFHVNNPKEACLKKCRVDADRKKWKCIGG